MPLLRCREKAASELRPFSNAPKKVTIEQHRSLTQPEKRQTRKEKKPKEPISSQLAEQPIISNKPINRKEKPIRSQSVEKANYIEQPIKPKQKHEKEKSSEESKIVSIKRIAHNILYYIIKEGPFRAH